MKYTEEQFTKAVSESISWSEVTRKLSLSSSGNRLKGFKRLAEKLNLDTSHFLGFGWSKGKKIPFDKPWGVKADLNKILVENSPYKGGSNGIKKLLIKFSKIENKCSKCGNLGEWQGVSLTLHLDHINGDSRDNRLENLRILCPNCHSQTSTFGAKSR